jgi:hypothetical protein
MQSTRFRPLSGERDSDRICKRVESMQGDERDKLNYVRKAESEGMESRSIRPFRLPVVSEQPLTSEDESATVRPAESNGPVNVSQASDEQTIGENTHAMARKIEDGPVTEANELVELSKIDDKPATESPLSREVAEASGDPALSPVTRRLRTFWINKKIASEKDSERVEKSGKKYAIPLRYKSLEEAMGGLRDFHPLPSELILRQAPHHATWLMTQLKNVNTKKELEELAYSLPHRELSLLFTTLSTKKKRDEVNQIMNLIRLRASHYLYLCGWLTFQYCYPRSSISRALSDLCTILEDLAYVRENRSQGKRVRRAPLALPVVSIGEGRIIWSRIPLISQISLPNSRHFIADIATEMIETKVDPQAFFREYAIIPGEPLANAIEIRYNEMVTGVAANPLLSSDFFDRFRR